MNLRQIVEEEMQKELRSGGTATDAKIAADAVLEKLQGRDSRIERLYMALPDPESPSWLRRWVSEFSSVAEKIEVVVPLEVRHERVEPHRQCA